MGHEKPIYTANTARKSYERKSCEPQRKLKQDLILLLAFLGFWNLYD